MRQIGAEKDDPLKRIQAEINEVEKRERELREKKMMLTNGNGGFVAGGAVNQSSSLSQSTEGHSSLSSTPEKDHINDSVSAFSDDSGISSSPSPVNGQSAHTTPTPKYIRSNTVQNTIGTSKVPSASMLSLKLSRTVSTPQIYTPAAARFNIHPAKKGIMQRFIASRGKVGTANAAASTNGTAVNGVANNFANDKSSQHAFNDSSNTILTSVELNRSPNFLFPMENVTSAVIERDADGRPVRRGFIPVEEKIQKELRDLRSRETELKRLRRQNELRQSQIDLLDCVENSTEFESDDGSDEDEYCYMAGKLRSSKSISELCDALTNSSLSERDTPSPHFQRSPEHRSGMKPALSLAQLCDVNPDEAPSSHRLIAQWENIIQQNS